MNSASSNLTEYECFQCKRLFTRHVFGLTREREKVEFFEDSYPEISIEDAEGLTCYCSSACMYLHYPSVMAAQGVPIPKHRPQIGPTETCAVCQGPVDMTRWHLTYLTDEFEDNGLVAQPLDTGHLRTIAVVCDTCVPEPQVLGEGAVVGNRAIASSAVPIVDSANPLREPHDKVAQGTSLE